MRPLSSSGRLWNKALCHLSTVTRKHVLDTVNTRLYGAVPETLECYDTREWTARERSSRRPCLEACFARCLVGCIGSTQIQYLKLLSAVSRHRVNGNTATEGPDASSSLKVNRWQTPVCLCVDPALRFLISLEQIKDSCTSSSIPKTCYAGCYDRIKTSREV